MSLPQQTTETCRECGDTQPFTIWQSLNVTLEREAKEKLLNGELTRFNCQKCQWSGPVIYSFLYHDMEKHLMIWHWAEEGEPDMTALPPAGMIKDYQLRYVGNPNELTEKILLFDAGLDDRVLEVLKLIIRIQSNERQRPLDGILLFAGLQKDSNGKLTIGFEHISDAGHQAFGLPFESYQQLAKSFEAKHSQVTNPDKKWLRVDQDFARKYLN
jgi:hypothetical protein